MQDPFVGQITFYPYSFAPFGWAFCVGQIVPISQFTALFSLLGTNFGGNGTSTFGLPDLRGRVAVGQGQLIGGGDYFMGEIDGVETVSVNTATMALHSHTLNATSAQGATNNPAGAILADPFVGGRTGKTATGNIYNPGSKNITLIPTSLPLSGGNLPHNNVQPSLVLAPCIALRGVFPSRN
jgi:microcystin-dependent protein